MSCTSAMTSRSSLMIRVNSSSCSCQLLSPCGSFACTRSGCAGLAPCVAKPSGAEAVSPRIAFRSASLRLGCTSPGARCVSDDLGRALGPHQIGEGYVRLEGSPAFTYHGRGAERHTVERGGFIGVGDLGYSHDDGYLLPCDRKVDLVISEQPTEGQRP